VDELAAHFSANKFGNPAKVIDWKSPNGEEHEFWTIFFRKWKSGPTYFSETLKT